MFKPALLLSVVIAAALVLPSVEGNWLSEQPPNYTLDMYCSDASNSAARACFTSEKSVVNYDEGSHFSGFVSGDGKRFVIFDDGTGSAFLQVNGCKVTVMREDSQNGDACMAADVTDLQGNVVDNTLFCKASASRVIDLPESC